MPTVIERINKVLYIPSELELSPKLEEIIFKINLQSEGEFSRGTKFTEIVSGLDKIGLHYPDSFLLGLLRKLKKDYILQEIDEKWFSTML